MEVKGSSYNVTKARTEVIIMQQVGNHWETKGSLYLLQELILVALSICCKTEATRSSF